MIFFLFKPLDIQQQIFRNVPQLKMNEFTMYELNKNALETLVTGSQALKYQDRYLFNEVDFTDNSEKFVSNLQANSGVYKNDILKLKGNVSFVREDGLEFKSKTLVYSTKSAIAHTDDAYIAFLGENSMRGTSLRYNSKKNKIMSKNVIVQYQIEEK